MFTYLTYFFSDILYKISVFLIENVSLKRNESFLLNKIINNILTKMFFCAALVLTFITFIIISDKYHFVITFININVLGYLRHLRGY